jgi:hypothetical protein
MGEWSGEIFFRGIRRHREQAKPVRSAVVVHRPVKERLGRTDTLTEALLFLLLTFVIKFLVSHAF